MDIVPNEHRGFSPLMILLLVGVITSIAVGAYATKKSGDQSAPMDVDVVSSVSLVELKKLSVAMEIYYTEQEGRFPPVGEQCVAASSLSQYLTPVYLEKISEGAYEVAVSSDGSHFVLRAKLGASGVGALAKDKDGTILGCDCNDPYYCVTEYTPDPEQIRKMEEGTLTPPAGARLPPQAHQYYLEDL